MIMIEQAGSIVEQQTVHLSGSHQSLQRIAKRMVGGYKPSSDIRHWPPDKLQPLISVTYMV